MCIRDSLEALVRVRHAGRARDRGSAHRLLDGLAEHRPIRVQVGRHTRRVDLDAIQAAHQVVVGQHRVTKRDAHVALRLSLIHIYGGRLNTFASLINQAVEDGAQIISVSQSVSEESPELKWAIANAISKGVIIVASAGNGASDDNVTHLSRFSGVVGVSAINADGTFASYSSWGDGVVTAAFGGAFNTFDPATNQPQTVNGTSVSAPLVAGMLALARQRWPEATTNQILQLLVRTGLNPNHNWDKYTGYGAAALGSLVNTDPSQYPDENPIIPKPNGSSPSVQEMQDYMEMCIRDRADAARREALQAFETLRATQKEVSKSVGRASKEERPAILAQAKELAEQVTVSYTHLDVYKRQV